MSVVVRYKTERKHCRCCEQKLPKVKISDFQEIEISKQTALSWTDDWVLMAEFEDLEEVVSEFIHETIDFWVLDSGERSIVEDSEIEKVKEFILREVVAKAPL